MKVLAVVFSTATLLAAQSSYACVPYNTASFDAAFISKAISSKAFQEQLYKLGAGSNTQVVAVNKESANTVTVALNNKCGIVVKGTPVEPKEGERACMNFEFSAQTRCYSIE
jgi:hypothetical protein